ncbi:MAG: hypothetical protein JO322_08815 [Candidatus Eremiobacteraeota bacterium]|nr:hypothetical protein [Candidatus Eremiobacteraeota bacterium]
MGSARAWAIGICAIGLVCWVFVFAAPFLNFTTRYGWTLNTTGPYSLTVLSVRGGSSADKAGVRAGDVIDVRDNSFATRYYAYEIIANRPIHVTLQRGNSTYTTVVRVRHVPREWDAWMWVGFSLLGLIVALVIVLRNPSTSAPLVSLAIAGFVTSQLLSDDIWPWPVPGFLMITAGNCLVALVPAFVAAFASQTSLPLSRIRRAVLISTYGLCALWVLLELTFAVSLSTLWIAPFSSVLSRGRVDVPVLSGASALLSCILAASAANGELRARLRLAGAAFAVILFVACAGNFISNIPGSGLSGTAVFLLWNILSVLAPFGLWYAIFRRRLVDIGFVLNRAVVFAGVSIAVVSIFEIVQWALGKWFETANHVTNVSAGIALALALGLSLRFIHRQVDVFVDTVFFRKRHLNEIALREFAEEAAFVTDEDALLDRTIAEISNHSDASAVSLLLQRGEQYGVARSSNGTTCSILNDDPALAAMRTSRRPVEIARYATVLTGEFAFPLLARGQVIGILVCGSKRTGEAYAPDEFDAIKTVAHDVGMALGTYEHL